MELRKKAVAEMNKITDHTSAAYRYLEDIVKDANSNLSDLYDSQMDSLDSLLDMVKDMIKQQTENQADALNEQIDAYRKLVELKKETPEGYL